MINRRSIRRIVDATSPEPRAISEAVRLLRDGSLVAYPTDTLYGLGADPRRADAVARLFDAKRRSPTKGIPLVAADVPQIETCVGRLPPLALRLAAVFWPGPLTMVIVARQQLNAQLLGEGSSVAIRVPDHAVARALADGLGHPVTATSVNISGEASTASGGDAIEALGSALAMVLDGGRTGNVASTIVDVRGATPVLLRGGVVPWDRVLQSLT